MHGAPSSDDKPQHMPSPEESRAWLAQKLVHDGFPLMAGDVVMTGTFFAMQPAAPGDQVEVIAEGLGRCAVSFAGS